MSRLAITAVAQKSTKTVTKWANKMRERDGSEYWTLFTSEEIARDIGGRSDYAIAVPIEVEE